MKSKILTTLLLFSIVTISQAQYSWHQVANAGVTSRQSAVGFSVNHYGFVGTGRNLETQTVLRDFWRYNPANNTWTQVANFGGSARYAASCFVINDTAYVGCGNENISPYHFVKDFWKYDQGANTWSQVADFGGSPRYAASTFAIDTKGYLGTGYDQATPTFQDFWEYNSMNNTWTQKSNFPGGPIEQAVGFAIGGYGYMGTGWNSASTSDFYRYDPITDTWSQIANLPTSGTSVTSFVLNNEGYVGTGSVTYPAVNFFSHFWYYTPSNNTWTQIADCGPTPRYNAIAFSIDNAGYCGTGGFLDFNNHDTLDFWKYSPEKVGINDITKEENLASIFPNPFDNDLNVCTEINTLLEVTLYDILSGNQLKYKFTNSVTLNTENLASGIYIYELRKNDAVIQTGKVVKK